MIAAAAGGLVLFAFAAIQLDPETCGYLAERTCTSEELAFDFDAFLTLTGVVSAAVAVVAGFTCVVTARQMWWRIAVVAFGGAALVGLAMELLDIPNR